MRKNIVAGNWKMNKNLQEGIALAKELNEALTADKPNCDVIICTPFIHLASVTPLVDSSIIGVGAENCADKVSGAYTGEVSAEMVASTGAQYVILGHSERRAYYHETVEILEEKVKLALANNLKPIFCIGEVLEEREANKQNEVVEAQLASVFSLSAEDFGKVILAYEPVWAIGTGKTATPEQAQEIHAHIRSLVAAKYGKEVAENTSILYGGSCKPSNAKELFANPDVDGGLIGGAALKVSGAYTGEVSAEMVASTGAQYVILGHSERRAYYHETVEILEEKVKLALANNLKPIFCIGEVLEEREANKQNEVVEAQLASVFSLSAEDFGKVILAYEPVWAIGTGKTATPEQAQEIHAHIRSLVAAKYGKEVAENTSILYGGSCKPSNAKELFANPDVDGGLIGGAALKVADFKGIIDAFK